MDQQAAEAARAIIRDVIAVAAEVGQEERARLGREPTEAEAANIADMVMRQFRVAHAMARSA